METNLKPPRITDFSVISRNVRNRTLAPSKKAKIFKEKREIRKGEHFYKIRNFRKPKFCSSEGRMPKNSDTEMQ